MSYEALVCKIDEIIPIQGANFIVKASVAGYNVIVSKETNVGDLGIFFGPESLIL